MKLSWVQDLDIMVSGGGAQLTDRAHVIEGIRRNHEIELCLPQTGVPTNKPVIVSNAVSFDIRVFQELQKQGVPYIWFAHDYYPICLYRLFYPMRDTCQSCYLKERWLPILQGAKLIIWLSPLHRDSWLWLYPELAAVPYHLSPSPVPVDDFYNLNLKRHGVIAVEGLHPFKGRKHILAWADQHPDVAIRCVGGNPVDDFLPANITVLGQVPYEQMLHLYNEHEALLHLPQSPSPFDRTVVEAFLSGCKIIGNCNIGALSYDWFKDKPAVVYHCKASPRLFWEKIEEVLS